MVWYLGVPWDRIVIGVTLVVIAVFVFWQHLGAYERRYYPSRAVGQATLKTIYWVACYCLSFGAVYYGVSRFMAPDGPRYLVGGAIWWAVSNVLNELIWTPLSQAIDHLLD